MIPRHMPEDHGKCVVIKGYVGDNHARDMASRRSHYGIIIYVKNAPLIWYSKQHNAVEASRFR